MINDFKFIPVVVINDINETEYMLGELCKGGLPCAEITFRTACAADAIKLGKELYPEMCIGAGTVLNLEQCKKALEYGAEFIVSPGLSEEVAIYCVENNVPYFPGCVTPTEIMQALELGITIVNLKEGYNGDLTSKEAGSIGGEMVRRMIKSYEEGLK